MAEKELKLKVAEAIQDDVNKGIVRIDSSFLNEIEIRPGDIVEMEGERKTVAIADRAYPADVGENILRIDGLIRKNARAGVGDQVVVRKASVKPATRVTIAPVQKGIMVQADPEGIKNGLLGRPVMKSDLISLGGVQRRRDMMGGDGFPDIFGTADQKYVFEFQSLGSICRDEIYPLFFVDGFVDF
ncbi:MAG: hypothetical protein IIC69_01385 [Nanoarchaeota archaeon]|nr:hypothetical protein [Nanoarchaeota archaeon]